MQVWGVILGVANETYDRNWKLLGPGTQAWQVRQLSGLEELTDWQVDDWRQQSTVAASAMQNISPSLLLTAFLPVLLFAAAFGLEWHSVRRLFWSSILLAGQSMLYLLRCSKTSWIFSQCLLYSVTNPDCI